VQLLKLKEKTAKNGGTRLFAAFNWESEVIDAARAT
jgi:hypothetical protein